MSDRLREVLWVSRVFSGKNCEGTSRENAIVDRLLEQRCRERKLRWFRLSQNAVPRRLDTTDFISTAPMLPWNASYCRRETAI